MLQVYIVCVFLFGFESADRGNYDLKYTCLELPVLINCPVGHTLTWTSHYIEQKYHSKRYECFWHSITLQKMLLHLCDVAECPCGTVMFPLMLTCCGSVFKCTVRWVKGLFPTHSIPCIVHCVLCTASGLDNLCYPFCSSTNRKLSMLLTLNSQHITL